MILTNLPHINQHWHPKIWPTPSKIFTTPLNTKKIGCVLKHRSFHTSCFVWCKSQELQCLNHTFLSFRYSALWQWSLWSCYSHSLSNIINIREHLKPTPKACRLHELSWICSIGWCLCWCCCYLSSSSRSLNSYYHVYFSRPRSSFPLV
jgi:hypothetical protein